jgi:hypothetical protein
MCQFSEVAECYSINLSARKTKFAGISMPISLATFRLTTSSNLLGCSIGISAGLVPRNILTSSPDAIFAPGFVQAKAAQSATKTIPILALPENLLAEGLTSSLARPDRNTTGISLISPDLDGKRGDLLLDAIPGLRHVAVLADPSVDKPMHLQALMDSAKARGIELSVFPPISGRRSRLRWRRRNRLEQAQSTYSRHNYSTSIAAW